MMENTHSKAGWTGVVCSVLILLAGPVREASGQVVLNEVMADNQRTLANENEFPDWVELINTGAAAVDLGGWTLTDNLSQPAKYAFPTGTVLNPGAHLLVYCDSSTSLPGLHTGFGLNNKGEVVALYAPGNPFVPADSVLFGWQLADYSIGRVPDASGGWVLNLPTPEDANRAAPTGSVSRLFLNEWMANDFAGPDWLELYNDDPLPVSIGGVVFTDSLGLPSDPALANLYFIEGGGFLQFLADSSADQGVDHLDFKLSSNGEVLTLYGPDRFTVIDQVSFGPQTQGVSQGRLPDGDANIVFFPAGRNTPAASNLLPLTSVVVNEVLSHTDPPLEDAMELLNVTGAPVDVSYWWLSDSRNAPQKFQLPQGTVIPAGGFRVFYEYQFNPSGTGEAPDFSLNSSEGDNVYIHTGDVNGKLTGYRAGVGFDASQNGVSFGRYTNSQGLVEFVPMTQRSFGQDGANLTLELFRTGTGKPNPGPLVGPLVFSEIMYHPPDVVVGSKTEDNTLDEYIEIYNVTNATVHLFDPDYPTNTWKVLQGVEFVFPQFVDLAPGQALVVVNFDPITHPAQLSAFRARYGVSPDVQVYGPYSGKLDNHGETLELYKPDTPQGTNHSNAGFVPYLFVDRVQYADGDPWPADADGSGQALVRRFPEQYGNDPTNWVASPPSPGRVRVSIDSIERTGQGLALRFPTVANSSYSVQYREALSAGSWITLTNLPAQTVTLDREVVDTRVAGAPHRFYRVVIPSQP
jgi:Lamin Tail Domain